MDVQWIKDKCFKFNLNKNVLATRKGSKLDLTTHTTEHSVDLHAACPRCLAYEASKPGATGDGESCDFQNSSFLTTAKG